MKDNGFYGVDIRVPRRIKQYGEVDEFEQAPAPQAYEPPPRIKARHLSFIILTITAFVLMFVLLTQGVVYSVFRTLSGESLFIQLFPLIAEVVVMAVIYAVCRYEQNECRPLSFSSVIILIIGEIAIIAGLFMVYNFKLSWLIKFIAVFDIAFALYMLKFFKYGIRLKLAICSLIAVSFFVVDNVALNDLEFTPRYIYVSTGGYKDKINDENNYYYENNAPESTIDNGELNEIIDFSEMLSNTGWGVFEVKDTGVKDSDSGNTIEFLNTVILDELKYGDLINVDGRYDDTFFEEKSLYFMLVKLDNPDDTVKFTEFSYADLFSQPYITYKSNNSKNDDTSTDESERGICIVVIEVPKSENENIIDKSVNFSLNDVIIEYR